MACLNFGKKASGNNPMLATLLKRGKSADQCKCIDFFVMPEQAKKGCKCMKPGGWTIDDYCAHVQGIVDRLNLKARAIEKIGLDESQISEIPPIHLASFKRSDTLYTKVSKDQTKFVTNIYQITWIFFSATQIYTYTYTLDTTSDDSTEFTRDFFYTDVTCIRTEHEVEEAIYESTQGCGCLKKKEAKYEHRNRHWDTLQITVANDSYSFTCRTTDTIEQSIQAAKAMIREKKQA